MTSSAPAFVPSKALQVKAKKLVADGVPDKLLKIKKHIVGRISGKDYNSLVEQHYELMSAIGAVDEDPYSSDMHKLVAIIRSTAAKRPLEQDIAEKGDKAVEMVSALDWAQAWCDQQKNDFDKFNERIDDAASRVADNILDTADKQKAVAYLNVLDRALGYLTQAKDFAEELLQELAEYRKAKFGTLPATPMDKMGDIQRQGVLEQLEETAEKIKSRKGFDPDGHDLSRHLREDRPKKRGDGGPPPLSL